MVPSPEVSLITRISYDHMQVLGNTLPEIAAAKVGSSSVDGQQGGAPA